MAGFVSYSGWALGSEKVRGGRQILWLKEPLQMKESYVLMSWIGN